MANSERIYLIQGNDTDMSVCLRKGGDTPLPYDLTGASRIGLALTGHGLSFFARDIVVSGEDNNIISGLLAGDLLVGEYGLEVSFTLDGKAKRFRVPQLFEVVSYLSEDQDGTAEGEGDGISITVTVQPEVIEISGPTGPQGKSAYQVWLDDGHTGTEDDFFEWLAAQTPNPDWNQNDNTAADYVKNRTHYEESATASLEWDTDVVDTSRKLYLNLGENRVTLNPYPGLFGILYWRDVENNWKWQVTVGNILELWEREDGENVRYEQYGGFAFATTPQPFNLGFGWTTVHKLPNKFLDMDTEPTTGSGKPVTSGGVKAAIADFVTRAVNDLLNYYTKTETYTKAEVNQLVAGINNWEVVPVAQLPTASADTMHKIYLVPSSNPEARNVKDEYITIENSGIYSWEQIGSTTIDLTNYVTKQELTIALADYVTSSAFTQALATKQEKLVSRQNIKTINGFSILGGGNLQLPGPVQSDWNEDDDGDYAYIKNKPTDIVKYTEQTLTDAQKSQARTNIAAASDSEVSQLRSEVYKDLPYTKDKYYVNLSSATVGSTYQFAELSFSPFAYWVIPCKEGDQFKLTTSSNTATAKAYAILDKNNVVLAVQQTKVTDFDLVIPAGGATLIVNTATANPYMVRTQRYATKEELAETDERLSDEIANIAYTVDPILENPLRGVDFGTTAEAVKSAITKIWLQSVNPANVPKVIANAPKLYIRYISNATGANRPTVLINDTLEGADTDAVISYALSSQSEPRAVKEIIRAKTLGGTNTAWGLGTDGAYIYIEIDWSKISGTIRNLEIELNTANLQKMEVDRVALSNVSGPIIQGSLYGKNIVCFGDSLTELADSDSVRYSDYLAAFSGANIVNVGIGGAHLRQRLEPVTTPTSNAEAYAALDVVNMIQASIDQDFTKQAAAAEYLRDHASDDNTEVVARLQAIDWAKVDAVTIFAGTNDWYSGSNIGTTGTVGKSTTIGAINYIIQNLLGAYPHVKIFWFTPVVRWVSYTGGSGTAENFGDTYQAGSYTLKEFAALVETEVRLSHLPVCDLYNTLGWNMWNFSNYFPNNDGTHPRKPAGMRGIAARMFGFLLSHKNY